MTAKSKSLFDLFLIYSIGNVTTRIINFALIFATTFYLTKEAVGEYDLILITISLLTPLATLQLTDSALRWLLEDNSMENVRRVFSNISFLLAIGLLVLGVFIFIFNYLHPVKYLEKVYVLIVFQSIFLFLQQCARGLGNNRLFALSGILYTLTYAILAFVSLAYLHSGVEGLVMVNIIAVVSINIFVLSKTRIHQYFSREAIAWDQCKALLKYSIPLIPNSVSWWAISSLNRYIILLFLGVAANGIYAVAYKIPTILVVLNGIFNLSWQDKAIATDENEKGPDFYSDTLNLYLKLILSLALVIVPLNRIILPYIVSSDFCDSWKYTSILMLGVVFSSYSSFFGSLYLKAKKTNELLNSSIFGGLVTLAVSYFTIPYIGLFGASASILAGYFTLFLIRALSVRKFISFSIDFKIMGFLLLVYAMVSATNFSQHIAIHIVALVIAVFIAFMLNKKSLTHFKQI